MMNKREIAACNMVNKRLIYRVLPTTLSRTRGRCPKVHRHPCGDLSAPNPQTSAR